MGSEMCIRDRVHNFPFIDLSNFYSLQAAGCNKINYYDRSFPLKTSAFSLLFVFLTLQSTWLGSVSSLPLGTLLFGESPDRIRSTGLTSPPALCNLIALSTWFLLGGVCESFPFLCVLTLFQYVNWNSCCIYTIHNQGIYVLIHSAKHFGGDTCPTGANIFPQARIL